MTQNITQVPYSSVPRVEFRPLMRNVYLWMTLGMAVTAGMTYVTVNLPFLRSMLQSGWIVFGVFIVQLILVGSLAVAVQRLPTGAAAAIFLAYAASVGFTLTLIVLYYDAGTVTAAFVTAAVLFLAMTIVGLITTMDLAKMGTYLLMGLIGLLIAMFLNIFFRSSTFDFVISIIGVILFTALTAYDTQKIKRMASDPAIQGEGSTLMAKLSILGALSLYLDFLNLFIFLLRILGRR
jgi:FtsH-binding integral membrane protein